MQRGHVALPFFPLPLLRPLEGLNSRLRLPRQHHHLFLLALLALLESETFLCLLPYLIFVDSRPLTSAQGKRAQGPAHTLSARPDGRLATFIPSYVNDTPFDGMAQGGGNGYLGRPEHVATFDWFASATWLKSLDLAEGIESPGVDLALILSVRGG